MTEITFRFPGVDKTASNHIIFTVCRERAKYLLFRKFYILAWWKILFFYSLTKYDIIFHDIAFYAFFPPLFSQKEKQKVLFRFLMHGKSNG